MCVETLTGVLFWSSDLLGNIFVQFVFHLRPSPYHCYYYYILLLQIPQVQTGAAILRRETHPPDLDVDYNELHCVCNEPWRRQDRFWNFRDLHPGRC